MVKIQHPTQKLDLEFFGSHQLLVLSCVFAIWQVKNLKTRKCLASTPCRSMGLRTFTSVWRQLWMRGRLSLSQRRTRPGPDRRSVPKQHDCRSNTGGHGFCTSIREIACLSDKSLMSFLSNHDVLFSVSCRFTWFKQTSNQIALTYAMTSSKWLIWSLFCQHWFTELPPVLTFELSRFEFNQALGRPEKIHNKLEFPSMIYMDRYEWMPEEPGQQPVTTATACKHGDIM